MTTIYTLNEVNELANDKIVETQNEFQQYMRLQTLLNRIDSEEESISTMFHIGYTQERVYDIMKKHGTNLKKLNRLMSQFAEVFSANA